MFNGRVELGLFGSKAIKNVSNFLNLMTNKNGPNYENTQFFKIVPKFLIQGGDIANNNGTGHLSSFNNEFIEDEIFDDITFIESGLVAMANRGSNTNGSQFFITLDEIPEFNGKFTIIGNVINGYDNLKHISDFCGTFNGVPDCKVQIDKAGIYKYDEYMKKAKEKKFI